jgi:hypothetical protein
MKRLFRVKNGKKQWWVVADHFPAAQQASQVAGLVKEKDKVKFVADLTDEYLGMRFSGLQSLLSNRKLDNRVVDIETKIVKKNKTVVRATRKFSVVI